MESEPPRDDPPKQPERPDSWRVRCQLQDVCQQKFSQLLEKLSGENHAASIELIRLIHILETTDLSAD